MLGMSAFACENHEDTAIHILVKWFWKCQGPPWRSQKYMNHDPICLLQNFSSLMRVQITETLLQGHRFIMTHPTPNMPPTYGLQGGFRITSLHVALSNSPTSKIWKASSNVKDAVARCSLARRASASLNSRAVSGGQACPMFQCFT